MSKELEQAIKVIGSTRLNTYDGIGNIQSKPISESHEFKVIVKALTERDLYYQALCDIESGKDVRMILERVLT